MASEMWVVPMASAASRSEIVSATFRMRSWARALRPKRAMALSSRRWGRRTYFFCSNHVWAANLTR